MSLLVLDTHLLVWTAYLSDRLSPEARRAIDEAGEDIAFSVVSIWEIAIKAGLRRADFTVDPSILRTGLLMAGYREISVNGDHVLAQVARRSLTTVRAKLVKIGAKMVRHGR